MRERSLGSWGRQGCWPAPSEGSLPARVSTGAFRLERRCAEERQGLPKERTSQTR